MLLHVSTTCKIGINNLCLNSMIFKTFDNDIDKWTAKIGIFGKSFNELGTAVNNAFESVINNIDNFDEDVGFWESLKNNLFPKKDDKDWKKNSLGEIISQENIDSYIKELDLDSASKKLEKIFIWDASIKKGEATWQDFFDTCKGGNEYLIDVIKNTDDLSKLTGEDLVKANQQARTSVLEHNEAIKAQTLSAKAGKVALQTLATAGNMLLMWGISKVIEFVAKSIDDYVNRTEKLKKAAEDAKSAISDIRSGFHSLSSKTDDIKGRYAELAQEIENLGKVNQSRGTLNTEDYEEFLDLSNQLAELFPQLAISYDNNGNAILNLSGNIDTIVGSLDSLVSVQQKLANQQILEKMPDVWAGYTVNLNEYQRELENAQEKKSSFLRALEEIDANASSTLTLTDNDIDKSISQALDKIGINKFAKEYHGLYSYTTEYDGYESFWTSSTWDFSALDDTQIEQLKNALRGLGSEYEDAAQIIKSKIEAANSEMSSYINTWLSTDSAGWNFSQMNSDMQNLVKDVLLNSDWVSLLPSNIDSGNWNEVSNWLEQEFLYAIRKIDSDEIQTALTDAFNGNFSVESLQKTINLLTETEGFDKNNPLIIYLQTKIDDRNNLINSIKEKINDSDYLASEFLIRQLTPEELEIAAKIEVPKGSLLSWDELITKIREVQDSISNNQSPVSFSDIFAIEDAESNLNALGELTEQLDEIQSAYSNLKNVMDNYASTGYITIDQFQEIVEQGAKFLDYLTLEDGQLGVNEHAMYELAEARIVEMKAQMVQGIIDNISKIETEADADLYLASTNYDLADSYHTLAEAQLIAWSTSALEKGLSQDYVDKVTHKAQTDIDKINALVSKIDFKNFSGPASSSAAEQAETDWKNLLDKETDLLEKQLAANLITFHEYIDKRRQIIEDYYRDGRISAEEYYDALESMYGSQLSLYDKAVNAVTNSIDNEIKRLNEQKEAIENSYQVKIDAIQEEIDALNKANDARKAQIDLEKAQYEAERARSQRVNKVYDGSQFVYAADMEAVRDAEENLADQKTQISISRLEAQIESLEKEMENATKGLDSQIDALESYKEKWNEISGIYEEQQNKLIAAEILGSDWESQVLNGRLDTLRSFTEQYIALQQAQADAAANAARIKAEAASGNATGGNVGNAPTVQNVKQTGTGTGKGNEGNAASQQKPLLIAGRSKVAGSSSNAPSLFYATMARFHGGLDEGYATAPGQSTPANPSLALLQKLADENLLPNELPAILQHGELVITPEQQRNIIANTQRYCSLSSASGGYASQYSGESSQIHIDSLTISCPNVTNNSGAEYILKSLERLPLDNIQHSHRRNR